MNKIIGKDTQIIINNEDEDSKEEDNVEEIENLMKELRIKDD